MIFLFLFLLEILLLLSFSRLVTQSISQLLFNITKSQKATVTILALLFFPGVVIHELSHFFMAAILLVPVGDIEFVPKLTGDGVKLGSVSIGKTDPVRRLFAGVAPVIVGIAFVIGIAGLLASNVTILTIEPLQEFINAWKVPVTIFLLYILFAISNTMFSSRKDLEGALELFILVIILFVALYFLGVRVTLEWLQTLFSGKTVDLLRSACLLLAFPLIVDTFVLLGTRLFLRR